MSHSPAPRLDSPAACVGEKLHQLGERHEELLARIDELNEQIVTTLADVTGRACQETSN